MFLVDAVAGYVTNLTERELDAPLMALLRSRGFTHVHLIHGAYEFGKDIIGRRVEDGVEYQYCIQSKAGDINASLGRGVRQQVDVMRISRVAHPGFNADLPRRLVVTTNGRLVGAAPSEFQDYNSYHEARGEQGADVWEIDTLSPMFYEVLIEGVPARDRSRTLELLGQLGSGRGSTIGVTEYVRHWYHPNLAVTETWGQLLTCAMLAKEAVNAAREDLASQLAFQLLRSTWEVDAPDSEQRRAVAHLIFADVVRDFWRQLDGVTGVDVVHSTLESGTGFSPFITHPVRVGRLCEVLALGGLMGLLTASSGEADSADHIALQLPSPDAVADFLEQVIQASPGLSHPISDDQGFTILASSLFLHAMGRDIQPTLREAAIWILDWIEFGDGFAEVGASADQQVRQLLGSPYKPLRRSARKASYMLTVVLDLARTLGYVDLYDSLVEDLDAVGAYATIVVGHPPEQAKLIARLSYQSTDGLPGSEPIAAHYAQTITAMPSSAAGAFFDVLATWATMRDRHIPAVLDAISAQLRVPERI